MYQFHSYLLFLYFYIYGKPQKEVGVRGIVGHYLLSCENEDGILA